MHEKSRLEQMILRHWQEHCPRMVEELRAHNQLENTLRAAEERTADLLYDLLSVRRLEFQTAWETATQEWGFLPTEAPRPSSAN